MMETTFSIHALVGAAAGSVPASTSRNTNDMNNYAQFYQRSIDDPDVFWAEQAALIDWQRAPQQICDTSTPPFTRWFPGATTNLCHNAVDRHLAARGDQDAVIWVSSETGQERRITYAQLHREVQVAASALQMLGVGKGDRVLIYMPMVPEALVAMLATVRLGAIHSVVFGGFASHALASRIDDARPKLVIAADAGLRGGKVVAYRPLLNEALRLSAHQPGAVIWLDRGLAPMEAGTARDHDWKALCQRHAGAAISCEWVDATHPSYILYTSGTTGRPKGVQRDTGGYAVALAASMKHIFCTGAGETFFATSDIGWVVGHSYIVYGPLLAGATTLMYEGLPTNPDPGVWWRLVEQYQVVALFSAPTAMRVLKKHDDDWIRRHDLSSLRHIFLAGEPLDEPTSQWLAHATRKPVVDNYWQTESGWPILALAHGVQPGSARAGSPGVPMYGFKVSLVDEDSGMPLDGANDKGVLCIAQPTPPGFMQTIWGDDQRFRKTYWRASADREVYSTFDWGLRDAEGNYFILGRSDDVINVAGHRLGTREIEECLSSHAGVAEVAVVGVRDALKGQVARAFVVPRQAAALDLAERERMAVELVRAVESRLGALARPARIDFVAVLPKTRSGKLLRRAIQALCEGRDVGDLSTMDDPAAIRALQDAIAG